MSVAFWLFSGFYSASKAFSTPLPCIMIIVLLKSAFLFFVLTSGRPLPVTTFFVFSKPLCSHFAAQIVIPEFSAPLQKRCLSLSKGFPLQRETAKICYCCSQPFYSSFFLQQRCLFRTGASESKFKFALQKKNANVCWHYLVWLSEWLQMFLWRQFWKVAHQIVQNPAITTDRNVLFFWCCWK